MKSYRLLILISLAILLLAGCAKHPGHFAVYFPLNKTTSAELGQLSVDKLEISESMLLAPEDIVAYEQNTHKLMLTQAGLEKIAMQQVPMDGLPFIAAVGKQPVYAVSLWTPLSSATYDGLIIMQPLGGEAPEAFILTGYPTDKFFSGVDHRSNQLVIDSFKADGKLK